VKLGRVKRALAKVLMGLRRGFIQAGAQNPVDDAPANQ
jgi:hypothetical protein